MNTENPTSPNLAEPGHQLPGATGPGETDPNGGNRNETQPTQGTMEGGLFNTEGENRSRMDFPLLLSATTTVGPHAAHRTAKVKLVFGKGKPKGSEHQKRMQPPSPMKDRTPKRHTSEADPPMSSPEHPSRQSNTYSPSPNPTPVDLGDNVVGEQDTNNRYMHITPPSSQYRLSSTAAAMKSAGRISDRGEGHITRDSMEVDEVFRDQSATAVADRDGITS